MMLPAALSILTTTFTEPSDRHAALGVWGGVGGLASAAGVLLGGILTDGPGWRWVMFVNPPAAVLVLVGIFRLLDDDRPVRRPKGFDVAGSILATGGMLLLVYALVEAPNHGWSSASTVLELAGAGLARGRLRYRRESLAQPGTATLDLSHPRPSCCRRDATDRLRRLPGDVLLSHALHAKRARLLTAADRRRVPAAMRRRRRRSRHQRTTTRSRRNSPGDRRGLPHRGGRRVLPVAPARSTATT